MELIVAGIFVLGNLIVSFFLLRWFLSQSVRKEDLKDHQRFVAEESLRKVETRLKALEVEWEDTYEKLTKLFGRITRWTQERFGSKEKMDNATHPQDVNPEGSAPKRPPGLQGAEDRAALWRAYKQLYGE